LGTALDSFRNPQRIVAGVRSENDRRKLESMLGGFCAAVEWMSVESAEMTKHALNAFLANSIAFMNEIACLGELAGADGKEVERGLKTDARIGPRAYLSPGGPFSGGTLARDVSALGALSDRVAIPTPILKAIHASNEAHRNWPGRKLLQLAGALAGKRIAVLGLTYKAGTDTLRRSGAVEFCRWLNARGAAVQAYDPAVRSLPAELQTDIRLCGSLGEALAGADGVVIATGWPEFKNISCDDLRAMRGRIVVDPNRFLDESVREAGDLIYAAVGYSGNRT
jgi:UDPglucose 6-dehydrogenase